MLTFLEGSLTRALDGPIETVTTSDTSFQRRTQLTYVTPLYSTPTTDYTALISSNWVRQYGYILNVNLVDSDNGQMIFSLSMNSKDIRKLLTANTTLDAELRRAMAQAAKLSTERL